MLAKVNRSRRHSVHGTPSSTLSPSHFQARVDCAPELSRWCDLSTPFTPVAFGGYTKYYKNHQCSTSSTSPPSYSPSLSQYPESPSGSKCQQRPPTRPLFVCANPDGQEDLSSLTIIHEVSKEPMTTPRFRNLSISTTHSTTNPSAHSLRRKRRQLLRTPSVERDFAGTAHSLFASWGAGGGGVSGSVDSHTFQLEPSLSQGSTHSSSTDGHSNQSHGSSASSSDLSGDSNDHSSHTASSSEDGPITPTTSIGEDDHVLHTNIMASPWEDETESVIIVPTEHTQPAHPATGIAIRPPKSARRLLPTLHPRPESAASFSTARSSFDIDGPVTPNWLQTETVVS